MTKNKIIVYQNATLIVAVHTSIVIPFSTPRFVAQWSLNTGAGVAPTIDIYVTQFPYYDVVGTTRVTNPELWVKYSSSGGSDPFKPFAFGTLPNNVISSDIQDLIASSFTACTWEIAVTTQLDDFSLTMTETTGAENVF